MFVAYPETDFGGFFATEADYRDPAVLELIEAKGWILWPPIPFRYDTIVRDLPTPRRRRRPAQNWLGTDDQARDVLARLIYGFRISVLFGLVLTVLCSIVGVAAGAGAGLFSAAGSTCRCSASSRSGAACRRSSADHPVQHHRAGLLGLLILMLLFSWMALVDLVRAEILRARNFDFVRAARALGVGNVIIMWRHVLPNALVSTLTFMPFILIGSIYADRAGLSRLRPAARLAVAGRAA